MKKFLVIISLLLVSAFGILLGLNGSNSSVKGNNNDGLGVYTYYEMLAVNSLDVLQIRDAESYNLYKSTLKGKLTESLFNNYFPTDEYTGFTLENIKLEVKDIKGDITKLDSENKITFKIEAMYQSGGNYQDATILVDVQNSLVSRIERI